MLISVNPDGVPKCLQELRSWIVWKTVVRDGDKPTKLPYSVFSGQLAKTNDPQTWCNFKSAVMANRNTGRWDGIGFVFTAEDEFCGIDLDGCRDPKTGDWTDWARQIMVDFNTYTELSPSGTGAKMFVRAKAQLDSGKKIKVAGVASIGEKDPGIEVYDKLRYFAVTGKRVGKFPADPMPRQEVLNRYCAEWFKPQAIGSAPSPTDFYGQPAIIDRARKYIARMPIAVSGQKGHDKAFHVACTLILGFGLSEQEAFPVMDEWSRACQPPWNEREIAHKLRQADKVPGDRNYLRNVQPMQWDRMRLPTHEAPPEPPPSTTLHSSAKEYITSLKDGKQSLMSLGLGDVDYAIGGGVQAPEVVIIAARPSHGKSSVSLQAAYTIAGEGHPVLVISDEMSRLMLGKRAIQYSTAINEEAWIHRSEDVLKDVDGHFHERAPIYVVENCGTPQRACESIRQHVKEHGVRCVVVDYMQLLLGKKNSRYEQVTETSLMLKHIATETGVLMIELAQLGREVEKRETFKPKLSDLRESGQIEGDADVILFLLWPHRIDAKHDPQEYYVFIGKNKNRPTHQHTVKCRFEPSRQKLHVEKPEPSMDNASTGFDFGSDGWEEPSTHQLGD